MSLTPATLRTWRVIDTFIAQHGYSPTNKQIAAALGICETPNIALRLDALENAGVIARTPGRGVNRWTVRGIRLLKPPPTGDL